MSAAGLFVGWMWFTIWPLNNRETEQHPTRDDPGRARLYHRGARRVDFKEDDPPKYSDFAYLALTIGMTYQGWDTDLVSKQFRATALRHALLSYLFGVVIIATMINLVAGLSK